MGFWDEGFGKEGFGRRRRSFEFLVLSFELVAGRYAIRHPLQELEEPPDGRF